MVQKPRIRKTVGLPEELWAVLTQRAIFNLRPVCKELQFLVETGLSDDLKNLRTLHKLALGIVDERQENLIDPKK